MAINLFTLFKCFEPILELFAAYFRTNGIQNNNKIFFFMRVLKHVSKRPCKDSSFICFVKKGLILFSIQVFVLLNTYYRVFFFEQNNAPSTCDSETPNGNNSLRPEELL